MSVAIGKAYDIRLHAIKTYGYVIHEFDPWFNYRATEYLAANGLENSSRGSTAWPGILSEGPWGPRSTRACRWTSVFIWQGPRALRELAA